MSELYDALQVALREADPYLEGVRATGESLDTFGVDLRLFELHGLELTQCSLAEMNLAKASFYDCVLNGCDLSNANLDGAFFLRTRLLDCKLEGTRLTQSLWRSSRLERCQCRYVNLGESKFESVVLKGCDMREAFLNELKLRKGTRLENCGLVRADLFRTSLAGVDLSTCEIAGLTLSEDRSELRGAVISAEQAVDVAAMLGVRIKDYE